MHKVSRLLDITSLYINEWCSYILAKYIYSTDLKESQITKDKLNKCCKFILTDKFINFIKDFKMECYTVSMDQNTIF